MNIQVADNYLQKNCPKLMYCECIPMIQKIFFANTLIRRRERNRVDENCMMQSAILFLRHFSRKIAQVWIGIQASVVVVDAAWGFPVIPCYRSNPSRHQQIRYWIDVKSRAPAKGEGAHNLQFPVNFPENREIGPIVPGASSAEDSPHRQFKIS